MDGFHYQHFLKLFPGYAYALSNWKPKAAVFHNGADADVIAQEFVNYLSSLPLERVLSYMGHTVKAVPFTVVTKSITAGDSLDSRLLEVEHHRGNGQPYFLYILADPINLLKYDRRKEGFYEIDITACIDLWNNQRKNKK